jgi:hypothetical protein
MEQKREPLMDQNYFDEKVAYFSSSIERFESLAHDTSKTQEHRTSLLYDVFKKRLHAVILRYSRGESVADLASGFPPIVSAWEEYLGAQYSERMRFETETDRLEDYVVALWLVSLAIIFKVELGLFNRLLKCIGNEGKDLLLERLVGTRVQGRKPATRLIFPEVYEALYASIDNFADRDQLMKTFLKKWYGAMKPTYFYNAHKAKGGFFGYWAFETAGTVAAFSMDDSKFRDLPYYPKDLVAFSRV